MIGKVFEIIINIVQIFIWTWFITEFFGYKEHISKWGFVITWLLVASEITFMNYYVPYEGVMAGILTITYIIYAHICLKESMWFKVFISIFSTSIVFAIAEATLLFAAFLSGLGLSVILTEFTIWRIIVLVSCRVFEILTFYAIIKIKDEYKLTTKEWLLFIIMPCLTWMALIFIMNSAIMSEMVLPYMFYLVLIMMIINIVIYYFMIKIKGDTDAAAELEKLKMQYDNIRSTEANMKALYDNTYSVKHDLEKHFLAIKAMAQSDKNDDIEDYTDKILDGKLNAVQKIMFTDNDVFNAIINTRIEICRQKGIFPSINVFSEAIKYIRTNDMAVLFGNIFDNAIEAAENSKEKIIVLNVRIQGKYISIYMENSFNKELSGVGRKTTKPNASEHGYGLKNVNKIVEKYDGMMQCMVENDMYCCDILLKTAV